MSEPLRKLGKHTLVYTAGIIIGKAASFVMLPVYTRYLSPADYGVLELLGMTLDVIGMITGVGLVTGVFKFFSEAEDPKEKRVVISTAAIGAATLAGLTTLLGLAISPELSKLIFGSTANQGYLRLYFLLFFLQNLEYVPLLLIRAENRSVMFVSINVAKLIVMLSLNILFIVHYGLKIEGAIASSIIAFALSSIGLSTYMIRQIGLHFSREKLRQLLSFGSPLVLWWLGSFVLVFSDRYFVNHYQGTAEVGIYSLAYKFAFLLHALAYGPFETIWTAQRFEVAKRPDATELYTRVFLYLNLIIGGMALVLSLFVRDFLRVMSDPAFLPAYRLVPLLIAAQVVFIWADFWTLGIYIRGKTNAMAAGAMVLVPITLLLNFLLIPRWGMFGAAWATMAAYTVRFLWIYHSAQKHYAIPNRWSNIANLYVILGVAVALGFLYRADDLITSLAWNTLLLFAALGLVYKRVLSTQERSAIKRLAGEYASRVRRLGAEKVESA
jgi:O-antigen/teichoic acid export membrane protein